MMNIQDVFLIDKIQVLNEGTGGSLKIRGVFQRADEANNNKRRYPKRVLESQITSLEESIKDRRLVGELDHPVYEGIKLSNVSHLITGLRMEGNEMIGEAEILPTPAGKVVEGLIRGGVKIGISSRGAGSLSENKDGTKTVNEDFKLYTFDIVADPSTRGAFPALTESKQYKKDKIVIENTIKNVLGHRVFLKLLESKINAKVKGFNKKDLGDGEAHDLAKRKEQRAKNIAAVKSHRDLPDVQEPELDEGSKFMKTKTYNKIFPKERKVKEIGAAVKGGSIKKSNLQLGRQELKHGDPKTDAGKGALVASRAGEFRKLGMKNVARDLIKRSGEFKKPNLPESTLHEGLVKAVNKAKKNELGLKRLGHKGQYKKLGTTKNGQIATKTVDMDSRSLEYLKKQVPNRERHRGKHGVSYMESTFHEGLVNAVNEVKDIPGGGKDAPRNKDIKKQLKNAAIVKHNGPESAKEYPATSTKDLRAARQHSKTGVTGGIGSKSDKLNALKRAGEHRKKGDKLGHSINMGLAKNESTLHEGLVKALNKAKKNAFVADKGKQENNFSKLNNKHSKAKGRSVLKNDVTNTVDAFAHNTLNKAGDARRSGDKKTAKTMLGYSKTISDNKKNK